MANPFDQFDAPAKTTNPFDQFDQPAEKTEEDKGFLGGVGSLLKSGTESALTSADISRAVIAGEISPDKAKALSEELSRQPYQPKELKELKNVFADVTKKGEEAKGFLPTALAVGNMLLEVGKQAITNPKGLVYMTAEQAANMAPSIAGMLAGGAAGSAIAPGVGTFIGSVAGSFAGSAPLEVGSEFVGLIGKELVDRKLAPTEENIAALLSDKDFINEAISNARIKGTTTAATDAAFTAGAGKVASLPRKAAMTMARQELGAAAKAAEVTARANELMKARTLGQKLKTGAGAVGLETVGGGVSEAAGQLAAYGKADLGEVGMEMLGSLAGSAAEVPAAARALRERSVEAGEVTPQRTEEEQALENTRLQKQLAAQAQIDQEAGVPAGRPIVTAEERQARQEAQQRALDAEQGIPQTERDTTLTREEKQLAVQKQLDAEQGIGADQGTPLKTTSYLTKDPLTQEQANQQLSDMQETAKADGRDPNEFMVVPHPVFTDQFAVAINEPYIESKRQQEAADIAAEEARVKANEESAQRQADIRKQKEDEAAAKEQEMIGALNAFKPLAPHPDDVVKAFGTGAPFRTAEERNLINQAKKLLSEEDFNVLQTAGEKPSHMTAADKARLNVLRQESERALTERSAAMQEAGKTAETVTPEVQQEINTIENNTELTPEQKREAIARVMNASERKGKLVGPKNEAVAAGVRSKTLSGVIDGLSTSKNPVVRHIAELAKKIKSAVGINPRFKTTAGWFDPSKDLIEIKPDYVDDEHTVAHEVTHALSVYSFYNPSVRQKPIVQRINALYDHVKKEAKKQNKTFYGLKNSREFLSEAFTNPEFQHFLSTIEYKNTNAWHEFTKMIANLLGIKHDSAFTEIMTLGTSLMETAKPPKLGQKIPVAKNVLQSAAVQNAQKASRLQTISGNPAPAASFVSPPESGWQATRDAFTYHAQDKLIDLFRVTQTLKKNINDAINAYQKEGLSHTIIATLRKNFMKKEVDPILKEMKDSGVTLKEINDYMHNRHAKERNDQINKINKVEVYDANGNPVLDANGNPVLETNPAILDQGSGIHTEDAKNYLKNLDPTKKAALDKIAAKLDAIIKGTQKVLVDGQIETQSTIDAWNKAYQHYAPLFREDEDFVLSNSGMATGVSAVGGSSKRATGSTRDVKNIFESLIMQREKAIVRAETAKIGRALYGLVLQNPNPGFWYAYNPNAVKDMAAARRELTALGVDPDDINNLLQLPKQGVINPKTGLVDYRMNPGNLRGKNIVATRIDGKDVYVVFNNQNERAMRMVESLRNADLDNLNMVMSNVGKITRYIASINTQYNPIFGIKNFIRDGLGMGLNLTTTELRGKQAQVYKEVWKSMPGIWEYLRAQHTGAALTSPTAKLMEDMKLHGGGMGFSSMLSKQQGHVSALEKSMKELNRGNISTAAHNIVNVMGDFNEVMESSFRLAVYKVGLENGMTKDQAAALSKSITVDFNKKGASTQQLGALYAFLNASIQGTARTFQTLRGPAGKKIMLGGMGLGLFQSIILGMAGFGEDDPTEFVKQKNFVIPMLDGTYVTIPMPPGLLILPNIGRMTGELLFSDKNASKIVGNMVSMMTDAFNPIGGSDNPLLMISPTALDPFVAVAANKDAFGRPISKQDSTARPTPGYLRSREASFEVSKGIAEFINYISGGTQYTKGLWSPTADDLEYLAGQVTGGIGRAALQTTQMASNAATGEKTAPHKVPLVGAFYGDTQSDANVKNKYYNNMHRMAELDFEFKQRQLERNDPSAVFRNNPDARFIEASKKFTSEMTKINQAKKQLQATQPGSEQIKRLEERQLDLMRRFNQLVSK